MPKPTYTVSQVIATPEGEWVNAEVYVSVSNVKPPRGKGPTSATLSDATGSIVGKFWGGGVEHWDGKRIKISGAGLQRKAYNGVPELSISQKADISFAGSAQTDSSNPDLEAATPVSRPGAPQTRPAPQSPHQGQGNAIHGATAGGCLARAVEIWLATKGPDARWTESSATIVEQIARQLAQIHVALETGAPPENVPF